MKVKVDQSCLTLWDPLDYTVHGILQATILEWGSYSLLQGIFPTQGSNPGLPHCRQILYELSHKGSPRILEWVASSISSGSSRPRNPIRVSCIARGFFANWAIREALVLIISCPALQQPPNWSLSFHSCPFQPHSTQQESQLLAWESVHITLPLNFPTSPRERPKSSKWPKILTSSFLSDFIFFYFSVLSFATFQMHWSPPYPWDRPSLPHHHQHPPPATPPKPLHGLPSWNAAPTIICMSCCLLIFS